MSLPLIEINHGMSDIFLYIFVGSLILGFVIFICGAAFEISAGGLAAYTACGFICVFSLITGGVLGVLDTNAVEQEREAAIESALGGKIVDGNVRRDDSLLLIESPDGSLSRVSFNVNADAGVMLLTPVGGAE